MSVLVDTVRISNFRSLRNVEVSLSRVTLLVGMNNSGKTSFLKAINLALGADRRIATADDFFVGMEGELSRQNTKQIVIDVRIIPVNDMETRVDEFDDSWINTEFGGDLINFDEDGRQYVAVRTRVEFDPLRNDYVIQRVSLNDWQVFDNWHNTPEKKRLSARFEQVVAFMIDAQRDVVGDLRNRASYIGRLLSKIEIAQDVVNEIESRLNDLNTEIVAGSEVLSHIQENLCDLNRALPSHGTGVQITPVSKKLRDITKGLDVQFSDSENSSFPLDYHGMGTRSWASLLTYQAYVSWLQKQSSRTKETPFHPILALEEPEAHLHPNAQRCVYQQLNTGVGQKIISTHSAYIAGQAPLSAIRHFKKRMAESVITSLSLSNLSDDDERKIRREVMNTRGELLFARGIVLLSGETEEQALPIFARVHWGDEPFVHGVVFVGVGGDANYLPFLRVAQSLAIPWFIFSDGESKAREAVNTALTGLGLSLPQDHVIVLPNGTNIEQRLVAEGYQVELKRAVIAFLGPTFDNAQYRAAKEHEVQGWTDESLLGFMAAWKTKLSPHWANIIVSRTDTRRMPSDIMNLLKQIDDVLRPMQGSVDGD